MARRPFPIAPRYFVVAIILIAASMGESLAGLGNAAFSAGGTIAAFSTYGSVWWLVRDAKVVDSGRRREFPSVTEGAAATVDGKIVEVYWVYPGDLPGGGEARHAGIDVLSPDGQLEKRWLFADRQFDGLAVNEDGHLWVSDTAAEELLQIDLADGSIRRRMPLQTTERLQDIDSNGFFYLLAAAGNGWSIRIRNPQGAYVRDISLGDSSVVPWVRIDPEGRLLALVLLQPILSSRLFTLRPDGEVIDSTEVPVNSLSFALTPSGDAWFGFRDFREPVTSSLKAIGTDGTVGEEIALPVADEAGPFGYVDYVTFLPRTPRGSLCDEERCPAAGPGPASGYPPGTVVAFSADAGVYWIVRDGEFVEGGSRNATFSSFDTPGVVATGDGKIVEPYRASFSDPGRERANESFGGIDIRGPDGTEQRWLFQGRLFSGIAIDESGDVWLSTARELLQIDLANGLARRRIPLPFLQPEALQDIDANGFFYLRAALGIGSAAIRIRTPAGAYVRDIAIPGAPFASVRIDREGLLLVKATGTALLTLLPNGEVMKAVEVVGSRGFALTPDGTAWFGANSSDGLRAAVKEFTLDGTVLQDVVLPSQQFGVDSIAVIPRAPRGSQCDDERCPAAPPTPAQTQIPTPTATGGVAPTVTPCSMDTATPAAATAADPSLSPSPRVTENGTLLASSSAGCNTGSAQRPSWPALPLLPVLLWLRRKRM